MRACSSSVDHRRYLRTTIRQPLRSMASSSLTLELPGALRLGGAKQGSFSRRLVTQSRLQLARRRGTIAVLVSVNPAAGSASRSPPSLCLEPIPRGRASTKAPCVSKMEEKEQRKMREPVNHDKLDEWIRDSIGEIVRKIGEAPFLVHIFSGGEGASCGLRLETEAAMPDKWPRIMKRWDQESCTPDAIVLVEELKHGDEGNGCWNEENAAAATGVPQRVPRAWGLVVQGRGTECASCYILNTSRVKSSVGFCTHFCLVRAKCFGEPLDLQLRKAWLQRR